MIENYNKTYFYRFLKFRKSFDVGKLEISASDVEIIVFEAFIKKVLEEKEKK